MLLHLYPFLLSLLNNKDNMFTLFSSDKPDKKFMIKTTPLEKGLKNIYFGAQGYSDYTINKDDMKKKAYIARHKVRENWSKSGILTSGFWSRWLLWNKKTLNESIKDTEKKFNIKIVSKI